MEASAEVIEKLIHNYMELTCAESDEETMSSEDETTDENSQPIGDDQAEEEDNKNIPDDSVSQAIEQRVNLTTVPQVVAMISKADLASEVDLMHVAQVTKTARYHHYGPECVTLRNLESRATGLLLHSGEIYIATAVNHIAALGAANNFARIIHLAGYRMKYNHFKAVNLATAWQADFKINLEAMSLCHPKVTLYKPELYPGLVYKMTDPKARLIIFECGKIVVTTMINQDAAAQVYQHIMPVLQVFKKE